MDRTRTRRRRSKLPESVKLLILGALEGDAFFDEVLHGAAGPIVRPESNRGR